MSCEHCTQYIVMFWESRWHPSGQIVLWDGKNSYWTDEMVGSPGYTHIESSAFDEITESTFTFIGFL